MPAKNVGVNSTFEQQRLVINELAVDVDSIISSGIFAKTNAGINTLSNVGIGTTNPTENLDVLGKIQIRQDNGSNNRVILRGQPGSSYRWNIDNYSSNNEFRIFREDDATSANGSVAVSISTNRTVTLTDGDLKVGVSTARGLILTSPNGTQYRLIVDNSGALSTVSI